MAKYLGEQTSFRAPPTEVSYLGLGCGWKFQVLHNLGSCFQPSFEKLMNLNDPITLLRLSVQKKKWLSKSQHEEF